MSQPAPTETVLRNATVLTMDPSRHVHSPGSVAIRGRDILAVGPTAELDAAYPNATVRDCSGHVIMPGLVNGHTHLPMSLLRGLADDLRLDVWLHGYILPVEREFVNPEFCFLGTQLACAEMIRGGVTCFADMYYHEEEVAWAAVQAGMRGICGESLLKLPTPDAPSYDDALRYTRDLLEHWQGHELIVAAPAPHSVYMCTPEILHEATALARQYNAPLLIHVAETRDEVDTWVHATNVRPFRWLEQQGVLEGNVVAAHCVHVSDEEIHLMAERHVGAVHNPSSNLKLASGFAPVAQMLFEGVRVALGTDGAASNNDLDMFEELRLASLLAKGVSGSPVALPASEAIAMATLYGAQALHLDRLIGSLEPGKRADLIVVDMTRLHDLPAYDTTGLNVYSRLAYASKSADVRDVYVNGAALLLDRQLTTLDEPSLIEQATAVAARVNKFFVAREKSVVEKLVAIGGLEQMETYEVQGKGVVQDQATLERNLQQPEIRVTSHSSRDQYDTYFVFSDASQGRLRYREDAVIQPDGSLAPLYTLTLTGPVVEAEYENSVVLSRARYSATADRSLRFYREYFQPQSMREIVKHRERYHVRYKGVDFVVNLDWIQQPPRPELYVEVKSRTWSKQDAIRKAGLISELLAMLGVKPEDMRRQEYVDLLGEE